MSTSPPPPSHVVSRLVHAIAAWSVKAEVLRPDIVGEGLWSYDYGYICMKCVHPSPLNMSLLYVGTVLRLGRDAWPMVR